MNLSDGLLKAAAELYAAGQDLTHHLISPVYGIPSCLVNFVGACGIRDIEGRTQMQASLRCAPEPRSQRSSTEKTLTHYISSAIPVHLALLMVHCRLYCPQFSALNSRKPELF